MNASRRPLPNRLKESINKLINTAGKRIMWGYVNKKFCPVERSVPTLVILPVLRLIIPR